MRSEHNTRLWDVIQLIVALILAVVAFFLISSIPTEEPVDAAPLVIKTMSASDLEASHKQSQQKTQSFELCLEPIGARANLNEGSRHNYCSSIWGN